MSCYSRNTEEKLVCLKNLSGTCHKMRVFSGDVLALYRRRICELFQMLPTYILKLIDDDDDTVYADEGSRPFQNKCAHFTVVFQWKSIWDADDCGRLLALTNACHYKEVDYTSHSFEKVLAGGSFSTPYTKGTYFQRYSLRLAEIMPLRRSAPAFHQGLVYGWGNLRRGFEATFGWEKRQALTVGKLKALQYLAGEQEGPDADIAKQLSAWLRFHNSFSPRIRLRSKKKPQRPTTLKTLAKRFNAAQGDLNMVW